MVLVWPVATWTLIFRSGTDVGPMALTNFCAGVAWLTRGLACKCFLLSIFLLANLTSLEGDSGPGSISAGW